MKKPVQLLLASCFLMAIGAASPAPAQTVCPEGRTAQGQCISPSVGAAARRQGIILTQQKFSYSTRLTLPAQDNTYRTPTDYRELQRGLFSTPPFPRSCHPNC